MNLNKEQFQNYILSNLHKYIIDSRGNFFNIDENTMDSDYYYIGSGSVNNHNEIRERMIEMIVREKENWEIIAGDYSTGYQENYREKNSRKIMFSEGFSSEQNLRIKQVLRTREDNTSPRSRSEEIIREAEEIFRRIEIRRRQWAEEEARRESEREKKFSFQPNETWEEGWEKYKKENDIDITNDKFHNTETTISKGKIGNEILDKFKSEKVFDSDLDSSLWFPYSLWAEKLISLKEVNEVENFKNQMLSSIEEAKHKNKNREEPVKNNSQRPTPNKNQDQDNQQEKDKSDSNENKENDLISRIENLKREIQVLKNKTNKTSSEQQAKLTEKENKLWILKRELRKLRLATQKPKSNNFSVSLIIGGGVFFIFLALIVLLIRKKRLKRKY